MAKLNSIYRNDYFVAESKNSLTIRLNRAGSSTCGICEDFTLANHYFWSQGDGIIGENFTNLKAITVGRPYISMLPLNLGASDGAPVRAIASW
jgi:kynurenine formamidase